MGECLLKLDNIHACYGKKEILRGVSFQLQQGEAVGVLGENGAGKSTLLRVIAGLLIPTQGSIELFGREITRLSSKQRHELGLSYLMQGGRVFPNLSVEENYVLALRYSPHKKLGKQNGLGSLFPLLKEIRSKRAGLLSGGQRKMLAIEMVAHTRGHVALWDEPTAGLSDENAELALRHIIQDADHRQAQLIVEQRSDLLATKVTRSICIDNLSFGGNNHV
jgi:ABC-type branched-subunit amino acid transport system ATPase component